MEYILIIFVLAILAMAFDSYLDYLSKKSLTRVYEIIESIRKNHPTVRGYLEGDRTFEKEIKESFIDKRALKRKKLRMKK
jgi:hypothetical protein